MKSIKCWFVFTASSMTPIHHQKRKKHTQMAMHAAVSQAVPTFYGF
jgi:hypothetical protein